MINEPEENLTPEDQILMFITESGFKVIPFQAIVDALAEMESYIKDQTGTNQKELDYFLQKIEELVGKQEAMSMSIEDIIDWVKVFQSI